MKTTLIVLGLSLLLATTATFAGTACPVGGSTGPTVVPADGRIVDFDFVAASGNNFYQVDVTKGHSYSIEVRQDYDDAVTTNNFVTSVYDVAGGGACAGPLAVSAATGSATAGVRDTSAMDPALPLNSFRGSIIATATGTYKIQVHNNDASTGHYVSVSVSETTLYSASFTVNPPTNTFYAFSNTSSQAVSGTLTLTTLGAGSKSFNQNIGPIPAGGSLGSDTTANNFPTIGSPHGGSAIFAHDGPPSSISAVSVVSNFAGFTNNVLFAPIRERR